MVSMALALQTSLHQVKGNAASCADSTIHNPIVKEKQCPSWSLRTQESVQNTGLSNLVLCFQQWPHMDVY